MTEMWSLSYMGHIGVSIFVLLLWYVSLHFPWYLKARTHTPSHTLSLTHTHTPQHTHTHTHTHTHVYITHDCSRCCRTRSASLFLAISFCVLLFRTWVRCKILNCTSFLHRFFLFSFFSFPQQEEESRLWGCKPEHITVFMESEFGCKMFLCFILLDPVQSYS